MVALGNMGWLSELSIRVSNHGDQNLKRPSEDPKKTSNNLGILAFETAKTMSKLLSLYKSLSDEEISRVRNDVFRSEGITYLNSTDENLLLSLACAERLEDLDKSATVVSRLGQKCRDFGLSRFHVIYSDLKLGTIDLRKMEYGSRDIEKRVEKMEKLIKATSALYSALEGLAELEVSERRLRQWKEKSPMHLHNANTDHFYQKLDQQRKDVRHLREISLWSQTFDKCVDLMARTICIVYARICSVFGPYLPVVPSISTRSSHQRGIVRIQTESCTIDTMKEQICSRSGPIPSTSKPNFVRFYSRKSLIFGLDEDDSFGSKKGAENNRLFQVAGPSTVGGSGLALRYANVIVFAEKYLLDSSEPIDADTREYLYELLPENLKCLVRSKLSKKMMKDSWDQDEMLARGWRDALKEILRWLAPIAHNTIQWQMDRNPEKMKFDLKPNVLLLETLHFSDKEKTEAAIAEVLVALSCICRYEGSRSSES
ncbi:hypothetical protein M9H77_03713 [Catharanthus roseus]|uniref:Uncharacterized protein n=1 Tax=Catharanthus roseus TaxID=4058 RepID=A0ACC0CC70_CATRO|nr:hypothetical protein M9H77_03713 [Catharanthus roseus]